MLKRSPVRQKRSAEAISAGGLKAWVERTLVRYRPMSNQSRTDEILTELCDDDDLWGPLLFLRPKPEQALGAGRVLAVAVVFGIFWGMFGNVVVKLLHHAGVHRPPIYALPLILMVLCFACCEVTLVRAWNRRARRLLRRSDWTQATSVAPEPLQSPHNDQPNP